eukprot:TRINITY_DN35578_c0_g1_i1.p1 TRINITY_DN35578_c0_g1~~TRINITY_DN35578_c0_g1_i1.p1  ORF type:complete len:658 (+),score=134.21 TRINITY_DN35578_c0_g1_i1:81-1976(+)
MARGGGQDEGDESPMLFFGLAILSCLIVPWTYFVLCALLFPGALQVQQAFPKATEAGVRVRHCQTEVMASERSKETSRLSSRKTLFTGGYIFRLLILSLLWCWLLYIISEVRNVMATSSLYANFDPYSILEVSSMTSTSSDIKKAYRKMSLKYHPDRNREVGAAEQFMIIKKAYDALTDPIAKRNYKLYGNPDGPTRVRLSVAIPKISKEQQGLVLILFLLFFVIGVPLLMLWLMSTPSVGANGLKETANQALRANVDPTMKVSQAQELMGRASVASRPSGGTGDEEVISALREELRKGGANFILGASSSSKKGKKSSGDDASDEGQDDASAAMLAREEVLFQIHVRRRHDLIKDTPLENELREALLRWRAAVMVLMQTAAAEYCLDALGEAIVLHNSLAQAVPPSSVENAGAEATLLQIPHWTSELSKTWRKGPRKAYGLSDFLGMDPAERRSSLEGDASALTSQQLLDIDEFARHYPKMEIAESKVFVLGEDEICANDVATVQVKLRRANLADDEAVGNAHTPLFPAARVAEAWWLRLSLPGKGRGGMCRRIVDGSKEVLFEIKFRVREAGKQRCRINLNCEAYFGVELQETITFVAKKAPTRSMPVDSDEDDEDLQSDQEIDFNADAD